MKLIKHHLETITGIEIYPLISFVIFFLFFTGLFIYVYRMDKSKIKEITNIPLDSKETEDENN
ncbi:MAG: CcoQ/FixQ family Cbb3-type cytochrome c oxidase assembly chaperone [Cytophagales bacterium]|nr:CcoQ/FixQ family Cbb3-type cytochrome c oxidase assembly chaperone [Cytophagales bacterium]